MASRKSMTLATRIVILCVSLALIVCAGVLGAGTGSLAGAGSGRNEKIATLSELKDLLDSVGGMGQRSVNNASVSDASENGKEYSSFTLVETTSLYSSSSSRSSYSYQTSSGSSESSNSVVMKRTLELYATTEAVLYKSEGKISSIASSHTTSSGQGTSSSVTTKTSSNMDFKVRIYLKDDTVLLYIERLNYTYRRVRTDSANPDNDLDESDDDSEFNELKKHYRKWIDCSSMPYIANTFISVNNSNLQTLGEISSIINRSLSGDESYFKESGGVYTMKKKPLLEMYGLSDESDADSFKGGFEINLSDKKKPFIDTTVSLSAHADSDSSSSATQHSERYASVTDKILFKNVNNTIVKDADFKTVDILDIIDEEDA